MASICCFRLLNHSTAFKSFKTTALISDLDRFHDNFLAFSQLVLQYLFGIESENGTDGSSGETTAVLIVDAVSQQMVERRRH